MKLEIKKILKNLFKLNINSNLESSENDKIDVLKIRLSISKYFTVNLIKWIACAVIIGLVCGIIGIAFHVTTNKAFLLYNNYYGLRFLLPVSGLIIVFLYKIIGRNTDKGTDMVISSIRFNETPHTLMAPLIFISTFLSHICGASTGREGASLQIGGSLGATVGKALRMTEPSVHVLIMCGMSAVFSAVFGTPIAATLFSMEISSVGVWQYSALVPCAISSVIAYGMNKFLEIELESFVINQVMPLNWANGGRIILLGLLCGLISILFVVTLHTSERLFKKYLPNPYIRVIVLSVIFIIITLIANSSRYNGPGMGIISAIFEGGEIYPWDFIVKLAFTAIALSAGFKGGEIVPLLFVGATFGGIAGPILGLGTEISIAIGMASVFSGATNCPITSILLASELFGSENMIPYAIAVAISYVVSGYFGLYKSQKIIYSKIQPLYIDRFTLEK